MILFIFDSNKLKGKDFLSKGFKRTVLILNDQRPKILYEINFEEIFFKLLLKVVKKINFILKVLWPNMEPLSNASPHLKDNRI